MHAFRSHGPGPSVLHYSIAHSSDQETVFGQPDSLCAEVGLDWVVRVGGNAGFWSRKTCVVKMANSGHPGLWRIVFSLQVGLRAPSRCLRLMFTILKVSVA